MVCEFKVTHGGKQVVCRKVWTARRVTVRTNSTTMVSVSCTKGLLSERDFEFTPIYDELIADLMEAGGFSSALVNRETEMIPFHNRSAKALILSKNTMIGVIDDWTPTTYHGAVQIDPQEHPVLALYHEDGVRKPLGNPKHKRPRMAVAPYSGQPTKEDLEKTQSKKAKFEIASMDVNRKDEISQLQVDLLDSLLKEFAEIFEDCGTVAVEPEEDWMGIQLKESADLESKGPYNDGAKDKSVTDETFRKIHDEGKLS
jgi:hypothetical protein